MLGRFELERRMVDVEVPGEAIAEVIDQLPGVRIGLEDDMGRNDVHPARDGPGVQIVHGRHAT
jgi:hypothetical protein